MMFSGEVEFICLLSNNPLLFSVCPSGLCNGRLRRVINIIMALFEMLIGLHFGSLFKQNDRSMTLNGFSSLYRHN